MGDLLIKSVLTKLLHSEPFRGKFARNQFKEGSLFPKDELVIRSLNDQAGRLSIDSIRRYPFKRGSTATIRISDTPLNVITPNISYPS